MFQVPSRDRTGGSRSNGFFLSYFKVQVPVALFDYLGLVEFTDLERSPTSQLDRVHALPYQARLPLLFFFPCFLIPLDFC